MSERIGDAFQKETKYLRHAMHGKQLDWSRKPESFKRYPDAKTVELPLPMDAPPMALWRTLGERRSVREYADEPVTRMQLSQLLWAAQGVTARAGEHRLRTAPSAGALYPVETYVVVNAVEEVARGIYHYDAQNRQLECVREGDFRKAVAQAALDQAMCAEAAVVFIWTAVFERSKWKYDQRAYRYVYLDAGHIAQNVALAAVALGLGSCQIAALYDDESNALLDVDGIEESTIYMTSVGRPAR